MSARQIPGLQERLFFPCLNCSGDDHNRTTVDAALRFAAKRSCSQGGSYDYQGLCWKDSSPPMIRVGSDSGGNYLWCMPQKPDMTLVDDNIGTLITETDNLVNRIWTDGQDPAFPSPVTGGMPFGIDVPNLWYYQLVYDREKLAVPSAQVNISTTSSTAMTVNFTTPGSYGFAVGHVLDNTSTASLGLSGTVFVNSVSNSGMTLSFVSQTRSGSASQATIKSTTPKCLWNMPLLQRYFDRTTILAMQKYYCNKMTAHDPTGSKIDGQCLSVLFFKVKNYAIFPMTKLSSRATVIAR
jgi:hypothetical protein